MEGVLGALQPVLGLLELPPELFRLLGGGLLLALEALQARPEELHPAFGQTGLPAGHLGLGEVEELSLLSLGSLGDGGGPFL